jgi:hypothetical protein
LIFDWQPASPPSNRIPAAADWAPNGEPIVVTTQLAAGEEAYAVIKMPAFGGFDVVNEGCHIELLRNDFEVVSPDAPVDQPTTNPPATDQPATDQPAADQPELGAFDFSYTGVDFDHQPCSTGVQHHQTLSELCVALQSPTVSPNGCALHERSQRFNSQCRPAGYTMFESTTCTVSLYPAGVELGVDLPTEARLGSQTFCVGRKSRDPDVATLFLQPVPLTPDVNMSVEMVFVPKAETTDDHRSSFAFTILPATERVAVDLGFYTRVNGQTSDGLYQYAAECSSTWSCD